MDQTLEPENQSADARRHPRFKIEVDIKILSRTCGALKGRTVDISESGISAMLTSNRPVEDWGKLLGDAAAVSAMLDRLLHHGHVLKCGPRSWRTKTDLPPQEAAG
jgi:hypothetical protein